MTSTSIFLTKILTLEVRCTDPVLINFYIRVFLSKFWYIYLHKLCFFEILFSGVDPFLYLSFSCQNLFPRNYHASSSELSEFPLVRFCCSLGKSLNY